MNIWKYGVTFAASACSFGRTEHSVVTPNMHLHCHLKSCVLDYEPLHGFWCFSFERYNLCTCSPLPDTFATELSQHIPEDNKLVGSLLEDNDPDRVIFSQMLYEVFVCIRGS